MDSRIALVALIVEDFEMTEKVNDILHDYRKYIIGRMGIPHVRRQLGVISVALDAPNDVISALTGKLGMLPGVSCKAVYSTKN